MTLLEIIGIVFLSIIIANVIVGIFAVRNAKDCEDELNIKEIIKHN